MALPQVNVTGTVYDHKGVPVAGAIITVRLSKTDLYQSQYVYPVEQQYLADASGNFTLQLFPNAIGELNTFYNIKAKSADGERTYISTTAVVPNTNTTLDAIAKTGPATPKNAFQSVEYPTNIPFWDQTMKMLSLLKNFNTSARNYIFPDASGTVMIIAGVLSAGLVFAQSDGSLISRTLLGTAGQITVTNGDGVAGNPTISLPATINVATSVVTPLVSNGAGALNLTGGNRTWQITTGALYPTTGLNSEDIGVPGVGTIKTVYVGTSVVTPEVSSGSGSLVLNAAGSVGALRFGGTNIYFWAANEFYPTTDNGPTLGLATNRWSKVFTPIIDSGTGVSLFLKTNNGTTAAEFGHVGGATDYLKITPGISGANLTAIGASAQISLNFTTKGQADFWYLNSTGVCFIIHGSAVNPVNRLEVQAAPTGANPFMITNGSDTDVHMEFGTRGAGTYRFRSHFDGTARTQFEVLATVGATRWITAAGSTTNPTLNVTAGSLAITPAVVLASSLEFTTAAAKIIPGATSLALRNNADSADNLLISDAGSVTVRVNLTVTGFTSVGATPALSGNLRVPFGSNGGLWSRNSANSSDILIIETATQNAIADVVKIGTTSSVGVLLQGRSGGAAPTTADISSGQWALWRDTGGATTKLYYNNAGAIQSVALA